MIELLLGVLALAPVPIDFEHLPPGQAPTISWYSDGVIHSGDGVGEAGLGGRDPASFVEVHGGYVAHVWGGPGEPSADDALVFLSRGTTRVLATAPGDSAEIFGPVLSGDGRRMAWSVVEGLDGFGSDADGPLSTLVLADTETGDTIKTFRVDDDLWAKGFVADAVVLNRGLDTGVVSWSPYLGTLLEWKDAGEVTAVSDVRGLAAVSDGQGCTSVRDVRRERERWRTCEGTVAGFSPDGEFAVVRQDVDDDTVMVGVLQAATGRPMLRLSTGGGTPEVAWESSRSFVLTAWDTGRMAIVRCTTTGECGLATPPRPTDAGWPYLLPDQ
ncbi:hypothetical protein [Flindersiella endophytica]